MLFIYLLIYYHLKSIIIIFTIIRFAFHTILFLPFFQSLVRFSSLFEFSFRDGSSFALALSLEVRDKDSFPHHLAFCVLNAFRG